MKKDFKDINGHVLLKQADLNLVGSQSRMFWFVRRHFDGDFSMVRFVSWIPSRVYLVEGGLFQPHFSPLLEGKLFNLELFLQLLNEVRKSSIVELILMEICS